MTNEDNTATEEKNWIIVLRRIASISGTTVPELLNDMWQCHADYVDSITPFKGSELTGELSPNLEPSLTKPIITL